MISRSWDAVIFFPLTYMYVHWSGLNALTYRRAQLIYKKLGISYIIIICIGDNAMSSANTRNLRTTLICMYSEYHKCGLLSAVHACMYILEERGLCIFALAGLG